MNLAASIVPLTAAHWPQVEAIYAAGIATGDATFEAEPPSWTAVSAVSDRCVYAGVVEHSVYVDPATQGRGIGRLLLDGLAEATEAAGIWTIQSGIFPENTRSLKLHALAGFEVVGTRRRLGRMTHGPFAGQWRDVIMIERRSVVAGR